MKAVIIENNVVTNIAKVSDESFAESQGWVVSNTAKIGDAYDPQTGEFTTPVEPEKIPTSVSDRQGVQQLIIEGLDDQVETAIDNISDTTERKLTRNWYQRAKTWERDNQQLLSLTNALGLTDQQIDDLFKDASKL